MSSSVTLTVKLFGALSGLDNNDQLLLTLPHGVTLAEVRFALKKNLNNNQLVDDSAFADEEQILAEDAVFICDTQIAILPPVCGG